MFGSLGGWEIGAILAVVVLLFGVGRVSGLGRELGSSIKEFRKAVKDEDDEQENTLEASSDATTTSTPPKVTSSVEPPAPSSQSSSESKPPTVF